MRRLVWIMGMLLIGSTSALAAPEQCRFIKAKADREACYTRQEAELAAKRKSDNPKMTDEVDRLKVENDRISAKLKNICRGC